MADLQGKVVLVTGAGAGIGRETVRALARKGAHVLAAARSTARVQPLLDELAREGHSAEALVVDLASLKSIRAAAGLVAAKHPRLHALVNNAGVWSGRRETTGDGFEHTWAVNVLAPFLLTELLLEPLRSGKGRVVNVSSREHEAGRMNWDDLQYEKGFGARKAYQQSKLALTMLTNELARREEGRLVANSLHPGVIATELFRNFPGFIRFWINLLMRSPEDGAQPQIKLASAPEFETVSGRYFRRFKEAPAHKLAQDKAAMQRLWDICREHTGRL